MFSPPGERSEVRGWSLAHLAALAARRNWNIIPRGVLMAGAMAGGIMFFMLLVGTVILGVYTLAYTAHIVLTVIDTTAAGSDEVAWPDEPYLDWLWKFVYMFWLVAVWLVPLVFVSRWLLDTLPAAAALPRILAAAAVLFWLLFPVSMLSSMSATSRWVIFAPALLPRLAGRAGSVVMFYLLTGPLLAVGVGALLLLLYVGPALLVPVGGLGVAAVLLVYFRLFGRLALQLRFTRDRERRPRVGRRVAPQVRAAARVARSAPRGGVIRASDLPPVNAPDEEARVGYDVRLEDVPQPEPDAAPRSRRPVDAEEGRYDLADGPATVATSRGPLPAKLLNPSEYELDLAGRGRATRPPKHPWSEGVWLFPFWAANRGPLVWMALGFTMMGTFFRLMLSFVPG
jgi:hypothetical protein